MPDNNVLLGCDFDAATASALNGKDIVALVTNREGDALLAIAGQTGLNFNMTQETTEAKASKDDGASGWTMKFHASKSWDASIDGLFVPDDEAQQLIAAAIAEGVYVCLKICERIKNIDHSITYQPLRMGLAIVTGSKLDAPNDDVATYSMDFEGSGAPWLYETATSAEREAAAFTIGDCTLSALTLSNVTLSPSFSSSKTEYTGATTSASTTISATATDSDATIAIKNGSTTVTNGGSASLSSGANSITVTVTNDGYSKTYSITVTKS